MQANRCVAFGIRWQRSAALVLAGLLGSLLAPAAHAQNLCIPTPLELPGLSGPPDWQAPGTVRTELNDPRWAAAPLTTFDSDLLASEGLYRLLINAAHTELSVSFQAPTDPHQPSNADAIYFGFTIDGTSGTLAQGVRINVATLGSDPVAVDSGHVLVSGYEYDVARSAAARWQSTVSGPAWLKETAQWRSDPDAAWGISFKVDLAAAGLSTTLPFKMMLAMHKQHELDVPSSIDIATPGTLGYLPGTLFIGDPADWKQVDAIDTGCTGGIALGEDQLGTRNASPTHIDRSEGSSNLFFATPTYPTPPVFSGWIQGSLRLANWDVFGAPDAPWVTIPNASAVLNGAAPATDYETLEFACPQNTAGQICGLALSAETQQCVLVELRAAPGQVARFTQAAAYFCSPAPEPPDAGADASVPDPAVPDATAPDAAMTDGSEPDSGQLDVDAAASPDASGVMDAAAASPDASGVMDAAAASPDASGVMDAAPSTMGSDAAAMHAENAGESGGGCAAMGGRTPSIAPLALLAGLCLWRRRRASSSTTSSNQSGCVPASDFLRARSRAQASLVPTAWMRRNGRDASSS